jgi:addiction module HigA family antidote
MARTAIHPGEILAAELDAIGLSAAELARFVDVPANRISQIVANRRNVTADTALRLGRYFGTSADFWMNLQKSYELDQARAEIGPALERIPQRPSSDPIPDARHT